MSLPINHSIARLSQSQSVICFSFALSKRKETRPVTLVLPAEDKPKGVWTFYCAYHHFKATKNTHMTQWLHGLGGEKTHGKLRVVDAGRESSGHPISSAWARWLIPVTTKQVQSLWEMHTTSIKKVEKEGAQHDELETQGRSYLARLLASANLHVKPIKPLRLYPKPTLTKQSSPHRKVIQILHSDPPRTRSKQPKNRDFLGSITQLGTSFFRQPLKRAPSFTLSDSASSLDLLSKDNAPIFPRRGPETRFLFPLISNLDIAHHCRPAFLATFNDDS